MTMCVLKVFYAEQLNIIIHYGQKKNHYGPADYSVGHFLKGRILRGLPWKVMVKSGDHNVILSR